VVGSTVGSEVSSSGSSPPSSPPSRSKATMCAVAPLGTVTTQKSELPAPVPVRSLVILPMPLRGSIRQGKPTQSASGHSISRPKLGITLRRSDPSQIGLEPRVTNVFPLASVLAPATKAAQLPTSVLLSPHLQSASLEPGGFK
jgi:hypothetical protein